MTGSRNRCVAKALQRAEIYDNISIFFWVLKGLLSHCVVSKIRLNISQLKIKSELLKASGTLENGNMQISNYMRGGQTPFIEKDHVIT